MSKWIKELEVTHPENFKYLKKYQPDLFNDNSQEGDQQEIILQEQPNWLEITHQAHKSHSDYFIIDSDDDDESGRNVGRKSDANKGRELFLFVLNFFFGNRDKEFF